MIPTMWIGRNRSCSTSTPSRIAEIGVMNVLSDRFVAPTLGSESLHVHLDVAADDRERLFKRAAAARVVRLRGLERGLELRDRSCVEAGDLGIRAFNVRKCRRPMVTSPVAKRLWSNWALPNRWNDASHALKNCRFCGRQRLSSHESKMAYSRT